MRTRSFTLRRDKLINEIMNFLSGQGLLALNDICRALEQVVDNADSRSLLTLAKQLTADHGWGYYPRNHLARQIHHLFAARFLEEGSQLFGADNLTKVINSPVAIVANHLSYADANVIDILLSRAGANLLADRLTAVAGSKVFTSRERRFSSLCFGTIKVPQSRAVSSEEAVLNQRDVALAARRSIDVALNRLDAGDALLIFGEGTRSRTGAMQPMLSGIARYFEKPGTWVLPVGLTGSEILYPVLSSKLTPACVTMHLGRPMLADAILTRAGGDRRIVMDAIGLAIAELLPGNYRGVYTNADDYPEARDVLRDIRVTT